MSKPLKSLRTVYDQNAIAFDAHRSKVLFEKEWLDRFLAMLPNNGTILDLGCGAGEPIARYFIESGYRVTGVDFSESMLRIARERRPDHEWISADMRDLSLGKRFDGVIAWDSFFHLSPEEQRKALPILFDHASTAFMATVGPDAGEASGTVEGETVWHASLSPTEYEDIAGLAGFSMVRFVANDPGCDFHSVMLARRK